MDDPSNDQDRALEIIHLRCFASCAADAAARLRGLLASLGDADARLYDRADLPSDLSVHLVSTAAGSGPAASELGLRIADALRDFGQVRHSTWHELTA